MDMKTVPVKFSGLVLFGLLLLPTSELSADTIFLRNGKRIQGRVITQNRILVLMNVGGLRRQIRKDRIRRIRYDSKFAPARPTRAAAVRRRSRKKPIARRAAAKPASPSFRRVKRRVVTHSPSDTSAMGTTLPWRSALVPGWDRHKSGATPAGGLWLGAFLAGTGWTIRTRNLYANRRDSANAANNLWNGLSLGGSADIIALNMLTRRDRFRELESIGGDLRRAGIALGLIYIFNLVDAWLFAAEPAGRLGKRAGKHALLGTRPRFTAETTSYPHRTGNGFGNENDEIRVSFGIQMNVGGVP